MGTEVLRPQDLFAERFRVPQPASFQRRRRLPASGNLTLLVNRKTDNSGYNKKTSPRSDKKKSPVAKKSKNDAESRRKDDVANGGLVNGQVTLLKRGELLNSIASKLKGGNPNPPKSISIKGKRIDDLAVCDTGRIGSESPEMVPKQIRLPAPSMYAGSAISSSPSPRAVPLPSFFNKKQQQDYLLDDSATRDLRRMLRLD